jgi:hypothetical protein
MTMDPKDLPADAVSTAQACTTDGAGGLDALLARDLTQQPVHGIRADDAPLIHGVVVGELLALADDGRTPLVSFARQAGTAAVAARSCVDLSGRHIGASVVLSFEGGLPHRPIVVGLLQGVSAWPLEEAQAQVELDADGRRLVISSREQMVLRCGKASITLTKAGKVLIEGAYVLSRSSGVNRVKGGSVQIN